MWSLEGCGRFVVFASLFSGAVTGFGEHSLFTRRIPLWFSDVKFGLMNLASALSVVDVGSLSGNVVLCLEPVLLLVFRFGQGALGVLLASMVGACVFSYVIDGLALSAAMPAAFLHFVFLFGFFWLLEGLMVFWTPMLEVVEERLLPRILLGSCVFPWLQAEEQQV